MESTSVRKLLGKLPTSSPGDGGDYGDLIAIRDLGVLAFEVTDVLVALVDVDQRAQLAVTGVQVLLEVGVLRGQVAQGLARRRAAHLYLGVAVGVLSEGGGDLDPGHISTLLILLWALRRNRSGRLSGSTSACLPRSWRPARLSRRSNRARRARGRTRKVLPGGRGVNGRSREAPCPSLRPALRTSLPRAAL